MEGEGISDGLSAERKVEIIVKKNGRKVIFSDKPFSELPSACLLLVEIVVSNSSVRFFDSLSLTLTLSFRL